MTNYTPAFTVNNSFKVENSYFKQFIRNNNIKVVSKSEIPVKVNNIKKYYAPSIGVTKFLIDKSELILNEETQTYSVNVYHTLGQFPIDIQCDNGSSFMVHSYYNIDINTILLEVVDLSNISITMIYKK